MVFLVQPMHKITDVAFSSLWYCTKTSHVNEKGAGVFWETGNFITTETPNESKTVLRLHFMEVQLFSTEML